MMRTPSRRTSATSPSSRNMKRRVTGSSAATSEATKFSSSPRPMTTGQPSRARMMPVGLVLAHHRERVGALELRDRGAHRLEQILHGLQVEVDAVRDDLGVGLGGERVAALLELRAQLLVVLDDAVVHDGEAVARDVRMRVALARHAMRGPAGVRDADLAGGGAVGERLLQHAHLADGAQARQVPGAVQHGDAGRVVAAVFQPPQALHQHRHDIALRDRSDDSAHGFLPRLCWA